MSEPTGSRPPSGGLTVDDLHRVMSLFGTSAEQVRRDHAISHVLAGLSHHHADELIFFGGTALSRTHLQPGRLSEDIDLIATGDRNDLAARLTATVESSLRRVIGRVSWNPAFNHRRDVDPAIAYLPGGGTVRIQLLARGGYQPWSTAMTPLHQRYLDAPPATLTVPTRDAFIGWKTATWMDRAAARDLWDLWALARHGYTAHAAELFTRHGPTGGTPKPWMFTQAPTHRTWVDQLAGQTRLNIGPQEALEQVRQAWADALEENWAQPGTI